MNESPSRRVLIVDDHELVAYGLAVQLGERGVEAVCRVAADGVVDVVVEQEIGMVVLDLDLPGPGSAPDLVSQLKNTSVGPQVLMLSGSSDRRSLAECLLAGATAVMEKVESLEQIVDCIVRALDGVPVRANDTADRLADLRREREFERERLRPFQDLTDREALTLAHLATGSSVVEIAEMMFVAVSTVRTHVKNLLRKLDVSSQLEAVALANQCGWSDSALLEDSSRL